jgi:hypothetical protein
VKWERLSITIRLVAVLMAFLMLSTGALGASYIWDVGITSENGLFAVAMVGSLLFGVIMALAAITGRSPDLRGYLMGLGDHDK